MYGVLVVVFSLFLGYCTCVMNTPDAEIATFKVIAYRIRHLSQDPLRVIKTLEDLMVFSSAECTLQTTRGSEDISSGNYAFVILVDNEGNQKPHVIHLQKTEGINSKCIAYDPLTAWDPKALLTQH